jgi:hypothetical protein
MIQFQPSSVLKKGKLFLLLILLLHSSIYALNMGPAIDLNKNRDRSAGAASISMNASGDAFATWIEPNDLDVPNVYARRFLRNAGWQGVSASLNAINDNIAESPVIASDMLGNAIVVWQEWLADIQIHIAYARLFKNGQWQAAAFPLNNDITRNAAYPTIAMNGSGIGMALWVEYNSNTGKNNIYARKFDGTAWQEVHNINNDPTQEAEMPTVALDAQGSMIALWREQYGSPYNYYNVYARRYINGSGWQPSTDNLNFNQDNTAMEPEIAMQSTGTALVLWLESVEIPGGTGFNVFSRKFDGSSWSNALDINNSTSSAANNAKVAISDNGDAVATWVEDNGSYVYNVYARLYNLTIGWQQATQNLNNDPSRSTGGGDVAIDAEGNAVVCWMEITAPLENYNIFIKKYSKEIDLWEPLSCNINYNQETGAGAPLVVMSADGLVLAAFSETMPNYFANIFARQTALPYTFSQWLSPVYGSQQYIASLYGAIQGQSLIDIYTFNPNSHSHEYKTTMTIQGTVDHFAVYNKSDAELYSAIITSTPDSLSVWLFNGATATRITDLSASVTLPIYDAQWWAPSLSQSYLATISDSALTILDLVNSQSNNTSIDAVGNKLLWTQATNYTGLVVLNGTVATPYKVDLATSPISITEGNGITAPTGYTFTALSTCGDYIAVGLSSTNTTEYGYAQVALLNLDSTTNTLSMSSTATILLGQTTVNALALCCCCATLRPLLVGSYDTSRNYTISLLQPDLSSMITSAFLGNNASSVAWSCQGINQYLSASSSEINECRYTVEYILGANGLSLPIVVTH